VYFQWLQEHGEEGGGGAGADLLAPPEFPALAARVRGPTASVTDRVFAAHEPRLARKPVRK